MCAKIGRPVSENPKNIIVKVKVDESTNKKILAYCEKEQISKSEFIRRGMDLLLNDKKRKK